MKQGPIFIEEKCGCRVDHGIPYRCKEHQLGKEMTDKEWDKINPKLGSCPKCGHAIFESDRIKIQGASPMKIYRCIGCSEFCEREEIVPF